MLREEERLHPKKLEEVLEVQSLRRIISAYLNYSDAAEKDVRRYERSYRRLSPVQKGLISHYPLKFQKLRRCISLNTKFINKMLQAFEPPIDMSLDMGVFEHQHLENSPDYKYLLAEKSVHCCKEVEVQNSASINVNGYILYPENSLKSSSFSTDDVEIMKSNGNCLSSSHDWLHPSSQLNVPLVDDDKVRCIIRNIVRDWAAEGQKERDQCYKPILEELDSLFHNRRDKSSPPACLVPGAGLGRLALEISSLGFISQGNEFSYYMMICSNFILNQAENAGEWILYPWIHSNCNSLSDDDQLRSVSIPDIHPASAGITEGFSMCGGDFVEVYNDPSQFGAWDAVVTCFFLDTAHNIIEYIETISRILRDGGVWINLGPLLYHFADMYGHQDEMSIELSLEDVKKIILHFGFLIEKERTIETTYTTNPRSMMQNCYYAAFWTMIKK